MTLESKDQNSTFSEPDHVAYQIKAYHVCSNMVANSLPTDRPHPTLDVGNKVKI